MVGVSASLFAGNIYKDKSNNFPSSWPECSVKVLIINQIDVLIPQIYFWNKTLHVSDSYSAHQQEFSTVHTAMVYVSIACMTYNIAVCTVKNS